MSYANNPYIKTIHSFNVEGGENHDYKLDYLDKKIALLLAENRVNEISRILANYELMMITPEKLKMMQKNPQQFIGIDESINKFNEIKNKYESYLNEETKSSGIKK